MKITGPIISCATSMNEKRAAAWAPYLDLACSQWGIDTPLRVAGFLAQLVYESDFLLRLEEDLNYSATRLLKIFGKHFTAAEAEAYAHKPEPIANRVYANRLKNGPEASGDGWRYHGRGPIQATGRENYQLGGHALGLDLVGRPQILLQPGPGALYAAWYWAGLKKLNAAADRKDLVAMTKGVNGGTNGLEDGNAVGLDDRTEIYERALSALC